MNMLARATMSSFVLVVGSSASGQPVVSAPDPQPFSAGKVAIGDTFHTQNNLTNVGNANLIISNVQVSGAYFTLGPGFLSCGNSLPLTVIPGNICQIIANFTPLALGVSGGTYTITDNAAGSPHEFTLTGTGFIPSAYVPLPTSLTFEGQALDTQSPEQTVLLSNPGTIDGIETDQFSVTGDFAQTNDCGSSIAALTSCHVFVTFTPTALGTRTGTLSFCGDCNFNSTPVALQGTGGAASATAVPALSPWGLAVLSVLLAAGALTAIRRRS